MQAYIKLVKSDSKDIYIATTNTFQINTVLLYSSKNSGIHILKIY